MNCRTSGGFVVKVRIKKLCGFWRHVLWFLVVFAGPSVCNRPPRFLIDGQTEIVLRLKEGDETPTGKATAVQLKTSASYLR